MTNGPWYDQYTSRQWRYSPSLCGYQTGEYSPKSNSYQFVADQTLFELADTEFGQKLAEILQASAHGRT